MISLISELFHASQMKKPMPTPPISISAATMASQDRPMPIFSPVKMYGTEAAYRVIDRCIQIHGALGMSTELPLERWFRDLRVKRLGEGATEVQREVIARSLLR